MAVFLEFVMFLDFFRDWLLLLISFLDLGPENDFVSFLFRGIVHVVPNTLKICLDLLGYSRTFLL